MKILIVDDGPFDRQILKDFLESQGCETVEAAGGQEGLNAAMIHKPDLVISDILMPNVDGFQLLRSLKSNEALRHIPFVFYTAQYAGDKEKELAEALGAAGFLIKPSNLDELWREVQPLLTTPETDNHNAPGFSLGLRDGDFLKVYSHLVATKLDEKVHELERAKVQVELRQRDFYLTADHYPGIFILYDAQGRIRFTNSYGLRLCGQPIEAVLGRTDEEILSPWTTGIYLSALRRAQETKTPQCEEETFSVGEQPLTFDFKFVPILNAQGDIEQILGLTHDITARHKAMEQLRKHSCITEQSPNALFIVSCEGNLEYVNPGFTNTYGYAAEEVVGTHLNHLLLTSVPEQEKEIIWQTISAGGTWQGELCSRNRRGGLLWMSATVTPTKNAQGEITHFVGIMVDITKCKMAEEAERHSRQLSETISEAILSFLQTGNINTLSQILAERCTKIAGAAVGFLFDLDNNGDARFLAISGEIPTEVHAREFFDLTKAQIDKDGYFVVPRNGSLLFAPVIEGKTILVNNTEEYFRNNAVLPEWHPPVESYLGTPLKIGDTVVGVIGLLNRSGGFAEREQAEVETFAQTAALAIQSARTELARQEAAEHLRIVQKFEAIGKLAGGIAHDFNNLLTIINGYSELLIRSLREDEIRRKEVEAIHEAGERAADLTRQLLAFSRRQVLEPKTMNINQLILGLQKILRRLIREDIHILLSLTEDLGLVKADPGQMEQILINLVVNARDAMPDGGTLNITTANAEFDARFVKANVGSVRGRYIMFSVADTGTGMAEEIKNRIFEPFFTTKEQGCGTGLGLATVYGIVKQSGGYITVDSAPGRGSSFKVYLPRTNDLPEAKATTPDTPIPQGKEVILVVEDEVGVLQLLTRTLQESGYIVHGAQDSAEAMGLFEQSGESIDLLLTDVVMPGMSGLQLAKMFREKRSGLKVLLMSGHSELHENSDLGLVSGFPFLQKPFTANVLVLKVQEVLDLTK